MPYQDILDAAEIVSSPTGPDVTAYPPPLEAAVLAPPVAPTIDPLTHEEEEFVRRVLCLLGEHDFNVEGAAENAATFVFLRRHGRTPELSRRARPGERERRERELAGAHPLEAAMAEGLPDVEIVEYLRLAIRPLADHFEQELREELAKLKDFVQNQFGPGRNPEGRFSNYRKARALYCGFGIDNPVQAIYSQLAEVDFLGRTIVVHQELAGRLGDLRGTLESLRVGLANEVAAALQTVGGFNPRTVAGSTVLSNHALGLAIDINAENNPHIKGTTIPPLIMQITAGQDPEFPRGFDFGATWVRPAVGDGDEAIAEIVRVHAMSLRASDILKNWLTVQLQLEREGQGDLDTIFEEVAKFRRWIAEGGSDTDLAAWAALLQKAESSWTTRLYQFTNDDDLKLLRQLREATKHLDTNRPILEIWAEQGIRNLPVELVIALKDPKHGFIWGDEWEHSKDGMHFDRERDANGQRLYPRRRFRGLDQLQEELEQR